MEMYDEVEIAEGVVLPEYPRNPSDAIWQSKTVGPSALQRYKLTEDSLLRREQSFREMTDEEKSEMARERTDGEAQTWDEWEAMDTTLDAPLPSWDTTVDEEWWVDHKYHGTFEFHHVIREDSTSDEPPYDFQTIDYYSYEARFTKGDLDKIVLLDICDCT